VSGSRLEARIDPQADISSALTGRLPTSPTVAFSGAGLWLAFDEENHARAFEGRSVERRWQPERPAEPRYDVSVLILDGSSVRAVGLEGVHVRFPSVQLLPDDEILLVGSRCRFDEDRRVDEDNAFVFGPDGAERRHFMLGDGIEDIQVDRHGHIWVSYFDEGVFGRVVWGGEQVPPAASGLIAVDRWGRIQWRYRPPEGVDGIDDCYALNVADDATWAYYYSAFPLVRIDPDGSVTAWTTDREPSKAIAVSSERVLFVEGYWSRRTEGMLCDLDDDSVRRRNDVTLVKPGGEPLAEPYRIVGRGPILHVFEGPSWFTLDVRDLP
jgi:hypothetical protein